MNTLVNFYQQLYHITSHLVRKRTIEFIFLWLVIHKTSTLIIVGHISNFELNQIYQKHCEKLSFLCWMTERPHITRIIVHNRVCNTKYGYEINFKFNLNTNIRKAFIWLSKDYQLFFFIFQLVKPNKMLLNKKMFISLSFMMQKLKIQFC